MDEAVSSGGLVIVEERQQAYWEGRPIGDLTSTSWRFLKALAQKARFQAAVDAHDVFADAVTDSAMSTAWGRLKKTLPTSLSRLVEPGRAKGAYRLKLDAHRIHFIS